MNGSILVVDNDTYVRNLLASNLGHAGYRVACAGNVSEAENLLQRLRPDAAVLDWTPGNCALTFIRQLRSDQRTINILIVMMSECADESDRLAAFEIGADDFLTKPVSMRELLARLKAMLRRRMPHLTDDVIEISGLILDPAAGQATASGRGIELRQTEFRMLHFFMTHPRRTFSRSMLLNEIWGDHVFVEERTVDVHIRQLRRALAPSGHSNLIETVRSVGYRFNTDSASVPARIGLSTIANLVHITNARDPRRARVHAA